MRLNRLNKFLKILNLFGLLFILTFLFWCNHEVSIKTDNVNDFCYQFIEKWHYYSIWSDTYPKVNKTHIFCWEINRLWKPVGFHSRPWWINPSTAKVEKIYDKNSLWIYQSKVKILDIKNHIRKEKFSTMFPDKYSMNDVINMIIYAYKHRYFFKNWKFRWPSWQWFDIEWYILDNQRINTAYPIFKK